jgi:hypothetical protein
MLNEISYQRLLCVMLVAKEKFPYVDVDKDLRSVTSIFCRDFLSPSILPGAEFWTRQVKDLSVDSLIKC